MKYILKLLLSLLFISSLLNAQEFKKPDFDPRLSIDSRSVQWYNDSDDDSDSAFNIGLTYNNKIKDYKQAEFWYLQSWKIDKNRNALVNLGILYGTHLKEYKKAEIWYKRVSEIEPNNPNGLFNLALLYKAKLNNPKLAIIYYKNAIERESLNAIKNLSLLYYEQKDYMKSVEYMVALSDKTYTKKKVFALFRKHWKFDEATIKKGYEAQLKSKIIPEKLKYKGGI